MKNISGSGRVSGTRWSLMETNQTNATNVTMHTMIDQTYEKTLWGKVNACSTEQLYR